LFAEQCEIPVRLAGRKRLENWSKATTVTGAHCEKPPAEGRKE
jgi:hypothetical protein